MQPLIIPAVAVNAPHRRDRVWFIANRKDEQQERSQPSRSGGRQPQEDTGNGNSDVADTKRIEQKKQQQQTTGSEQCDFNAQNSVSERSGGGMESNGQVLGSRPAEVENARPSWKEDWIKVAAEFCSVDDVLPVTLDGLKLSKSQHRAAQIKAYGNAIVPQVAMEIFKAIKNN